MAIVDAFLLPLAALLLVAAGWDLRSRIIPNWLNAAIALGAVGFWWAEGAHLWPDVALSVAVTLLVFALFFAAFAFGAMGGGDVKLIAALALWLPPGATLQLLFLMSLAGGIVTIATVAHHAARRAAGRPEIPYGVAISAAGLWMIGERYLYQFA